jgi:multiple sugar transport system permease protein
MFVAYPFLNVIRMSFMDYRLTRRDRPFIGLANFRRIFNDPDIMMILGNSLVFVFVTVGLQFLLGLTLALALRKPFRGRGLYQGIVFIPWAFSNFIVALTFRWLFNAEFGPINDLLLRFGFITQRMVFLGSPTYALYTVITAMVWQGIPFFGIMILAALQSVPSDFYEAGALEGCTGVRGFFYITLPTIKATVIITLMLRLIWVFNNAELIFIMTQGGPANTSHTLASYMFTRAYSTLDFGFASAIGVFFMIILVTAVSIFLGISRYNEAKGD